MSHTETEQTSLFYFSDFFNTRKKRALGHAIKDYHLIRRRYIVSRAATHFDKNKHNPDCLLGKSLLDLGCGTSKISGEMTFRGADVTAIDKNPELVRIAANESKKYGANVNYISTGPERLIQDGKKFDIILCLDLFGYTENQERMIWFLKQLLNDDGIIIFSFNNKTLTSILFHTMVAPLMGWFNFGTYRLKNFVSIPELTKSLNAQGFNISELRGATFSKTSSQWQRTKMPSIRVLGKIEKNKLKN